MDKLSIVTINARGLNNAKKRLSAFQWIKEHNIDIALIQETYCTEEFKRKFNFHWRGEVYHSNTDSKHSRGVSILISDLFKGKVVSSCNDNAARKLLLNIEYDDNVYTIVNLYCPNDQGERVRFLSDCPHWVNTNRIMNSFLILGGDVNCVQWPSDKSSNKVDIASKSLIELKRSLNVKDVWKLLHPDDRDYKYIDSSFRNNNSRIDILCVCPELENLVQLCIHKITPCPDHKAVLMSFEDKERKRGKGYWKLNVSILKEEDYREIIQNTIEETFSEYMDNVDKSLIWELTKIRVKEITIKYCKSRQFRLSNEIRQLENTIHHLDKKIQSNFEHEALITERNYYAKDKLDILYDDKAIGAQIRSKVKYIEEGERSTSYFIGIEKQRQSNNRIKALTKDNITYTDDNGILQIAKDFYFDLFTSKNPSQEEINEYLGDIEIHKLSDEKQKICDGVISLKECEIAVSKMKLNKSPGEDGLPVEFYKAFWKQLGSFLVKMYNECFESKELPLSMRKSVITLIHKKDDKSDITNYRPISLTNTDYRILAHVLSTRLQNVISDLVGPNQVTYIKRRFIGTNIRLVKDIFDLYNKHNYPELLLFADFKKTFDSVEWDFLFSVLQKFNFGKNFQEWIKLLYTKPCAFIKNNGFFSEEFDVYRGVKQGCSLSSLLFILCVEVLSQHINQNSEIKGLYLDQDNIHKVKIVQYADDATLFLKNKHDLKKAIESLELFGKIAGTELNLSKCEGLWIGSYKQRQRACNLCGIKWPEKPIRYLGIYIGHDQKECFKLNFEDKLTSIDEVLKQAEKRNLTLFGKVFIIKSLAISKITYVATCLTVPDGIIKQVDQRIFRFLWGKRDRIKRKSIINKLEEGGLNMLDLRTQIYAIKASWTSRIITAPRDHLWSYLPKLYFSKFGNDFYIVKSTVTNTKMFPFLKTIPEFYQDVILSYNKSKIMSYEDFLVNVKNQPIWCNKYIKFEGKTLLFKSWIDDGIVMLKNIRINNGILDVGFFGKCNTRQKAILQGN